MKNQRLKITNRHGNLLHASLELPIDQKPSNYAVFAHCFTCTSNLSAVKHVSRSLTQQGFGVLRFDFTGLGNSEGAFADSHFSANVSDLEDVFHYMEEHFKAPDLLIGHSLGGAAVIVAASRLPAVKAIATIGAPATVEHATHLFSHQVHEIAEKGEIEVKIGGRPFTINKNFVEEFAATDLPAIVKNLRKPILILHSPIDKIVGIDNAQQLYQNAFHPKSFISLDDADHLLSKELDSQYVGSLIGSWAKRYFSTPTVKKLDTLGEQVVGHLNLVEDKFTTTVQTKKHSLLADEPASVGGDDFGPSPYELLNAGLAACTVMTLKMYANRKKWDLQEVYVYLTHSKKHIQDMDKSVYLDQIHKKLKFVGNLTEEQKGRLKEIASRCPVHRTLLAKVEIETEVL